MSKPKMHFECIEYILNNFEYILMLKFPSISKICVIYRLYKKHEMAKKAMG